LTFRGDGTTDSHFIPNGEWELLSENTLLSSSLKHLFLGLKGARSVSYYSCCPEPYIDVTYTVFFNIKVENKVIFHPGFDQKEELALCLQHHHSLHFDHSHDFALLFTSGGVGRKTDLG